MQILLMLFLLLPSLCFGAIAEVASFKATKGGVTANSTTLAAGAAVTAGDLIVVGGGIFQDSSLTGVTVTDTLGTSYTATLCTVSTGEGTYPFVAYGLAGGSGTPTLTVNPSEASNSFDFAIDAFTGVAASPLDNSLSNNASASGPGNLTVTHTTLTANALILGSFASSSADARAPGASWTQIGENESSLDSFSFIFRVVTTAGSNNVDWTSIGSPYSACTISFKDAASVSRRPVAPMVLQ